MTPSPIQRIGAYLQTDKDGFLPGPAAGQQINEPWASAVAMLTGHYLREWGPDLLSVYVRGSVARGLAIPGVSDIDSFGVLAAEATGTDPRRLREWSDAVDTEVRQAFPHVAGVEVDLVPFGVMLDRQNYYSFVMKTEAVCVHGENLAGLVQPFRLSEANFQTRFLREHLSVFIEEFPEEPAADKPGFVAWIAKRFLRLGMELVMEKEQRHTRDLYLCYESFARHYPAEAGAMQRSLELAVNPVANDDVEAFLQQFGSWLAGEADRKLGRS